MPPQPRASIGGRYMPPPYPSHAPVYHGQSVSEITDTYVGVPYGHHVRPGYYVRKEHPPFPLPALLPHWVRPPPGQQRRLPPFTALLEVAERTPWRYYENIWPNGIRFTPPVGVWQPQNKMKLPLDGVAVSAQYSAMDIEPRQTYYGPTIVQPFLGNATAKRVRADKSRR